MISIKTSERNGDQVGAVLVHDDDEVMLITDGGTLVRILVSDVSIMGRATQGVKMINVSENERLIGIERIASIDGDQEEGDQEQEDGDI